MQRFDTYASQCPTRVVLDRIADKWTVLVLGLLVHKTMRFNEMRREIDGISQKMLSQTLKSLERDGLVLRKAFATVPVTVEYSISPLGRTLAKQLGPLARWAETHMREVQAAQARYDKEGGNRRAAVLLPVPPARRRKVSAGGVVRD